MIEVSCGNEAHREKVNFLQILEDGYGLAVTEYMEKPFQITHSMSSYYEFSNVMTNRLVWQCKSEWELRRAMNGDVVMIMEHSLEFRVWNNNNSWTVIWYVKLIVLNTLELIKWHLLLFIFNNKVFLSSLLSIPGNNLLSQ